jgi:hypothetical protein
MTLLLVATAAFAQKAYDIETFKGATKQFEVTFKFAVGLGEASEATLSDRSSKKNTAFQYDHDALGKMELIPVSGSKGMRVVVDVDPMDMTNHKRLQCTVDVGRTTHRLTLVRSRD